MAEGALGQYRLEVELQMGAAASDDAAAAAAAAANNNNNNNNNKHAQIFTGRVVHLPRGAQTVEDIAHDGDPANLIGRFRVMHLSPDPCASADQAVLAVLLPAICYGESGTDVAVCYGSLVQTWRCVRASGSAVLTWSCMVGSGDAAPSAEAQRAVTEVDGRVQAASRGCVSFVFFACQTRKEKERANKKKQKKSGLGSFCALRFLVGDLGACALAVPLGGAGFRNGGDAAVSGGRANARPVWYGVQADARACKPSIVVAVDGVAGCAKKQYGSDWGTMLISAKLPYVCGGLSSTEISHGATRMSGVDLGCCAATSTSVSGSTYGYAGTIMSDIDLGHRATSKCPVLTTGVMLPGAAR
eukprot:263360-Rhodomonas_salina.6